MPPSGKSSVVMGMSPKLMLDTQSQHPESPLSSRNQRVDADASATKYMLLENASSLRLTNAIQPRC